MTLGARLSALHRGILALPRLVAFLRRFGAARTSIRPLSGTTCVQAFLCVRLAGGRPSPNPKALFRLRADAESQGRWGLQPCAVGVAAAFGSLCPKRGAPDRPGAGLQARRAGAAPASALGLSPEDALVPRRDGRRFGIKAW